MRLLYFFSGLNTSVYAQPVNSCCRCAPLPAGLFLLVPIHMAKTPASMCMPLRTLNDSLGHRRRYMVGGREKACKKCPSEHGRACCSVYLRHVAPQASWLAFTLSETAGGGLIDASNVCSTLKKGLGCFREKFQNDKTCSKNS